MIIPDNFYVIIEPRSEFNISVIMDKIKGNFGNEYNKTVGREGQVLQPRLYDEGITDRNELIEKIEYIHNNPVRAGLAQMPSEYKFSSYGYYFDKVKNYLVDLP